jgi:hypothetical protein
MGFALLGVMQFVSPVFDAEVQFIVRLALLAAMVGGGAAIYFTIAWWWGALDVAALKRSFSRST